MQGLKHRIFVVSDIHLEMRKDTEDGEVNIIPVTPTPENVKNYLALCGDIGNPFLPNYKTFLERHSKLFNHILIVTGNHEYYSSNNKQRSMQQIDAEVAKIASEFPNVTFLQEESVVIDDITFAGCTLWTAVDEGCQRTMNDYNFIYIDSESQRSRRVLMHSRTYAANTKLVKAYRKQISWLDILQKHQQHREWLENIITNPPPETKKMVILTHHAPSIQMLREQGGNTGAYASDCDDLFKPPVVCWLSGHTHDSVDTVVNGIRSVSNCYGYPHESVKITGLRTSFYVEI